MDEQGERGGGRVSTRPVLTEAEAEILALSLAFARECREGLAASDGFLEAELLDGARELLRPADVRRQRGAVYRGLDFGRATEGGVGHVPGDDADAL